MIFRRLSVTTIVLFSFCASLHAGPVQHVLDTTGYNFQLDGGGGGAQAQLDKSQNIEIFCVDFANDIYVPQNYSAYLTTITSGSVLNETRFGNVLNWTTLANQNSLTNASVINGANDLGRYQMAAYLVSQYSLSLGRTTAFSLNGNSTSNDGIQQAIWDILDPMNENAGQIGTLAATDSALQAAAHWYSATGGNGSANRDAFLSNFRIVSDTSLKTSCGGVLWGCGFQEQITVVPEPRHLALMLIGLLLVGSAALRKLRNAQRSNG